MGISLTGAPFYYPLQDELSDPFYPTKGDKAKFDDCQGSLSSDGTYHYYGPSNCIVEYIDQSGKYNETDPVEALQWAYLNRPRTAIGISKDGNIIYSPTYTKNYDKGMYYDECQPNLCNGVVLESAYAYVATLKFPYIMGCFGNGATLTKGMYPSCSNNTRCGNLVETAAEEKAIKKKKEKEERDKGALPSI